MSFSQAPQSGSGVLDGLATAVMGLGVGDRWSLPVETAVRRADYQPVQDWSPS